MGDPSAIGPGPLMGEEHRPALRRYRALESEPQAVYHDVVQLALAITGRPMGALMFVDDRCQWLKAAIGIQLPEVAPTDSLTACTIESDEVVVIGDVANDAPVADNPLVRLPPLVRFYAGAALRPPDAGDAPIGTLCVFDTRPGEMSERERAAFQALTRATMRHFHARQREADLEVARRAESRIQQAQRLETLGRFVGGVAHDFNNLLAVISLATDLLIDRADPRSMPAVRQVRVATDTAASITRQLLAFSRGGGTARHLLDINAVVNDMRPLLQRIVGSATLVTDLQPDLPMVLANQGLVERVLLNLLVNASDAMGSEGVATVLTAHVSAANADELGMRSASSDSYVSLSVSDNGRGMSPEVSDRAFEPFFTTKGPGRGTGFGLSTVHGIATSLGGEATIESVVGIGTTVTMLLPVATEESGSVAPEPEHSAQGEVLLVVEDEDPLRELLATVLERAGYQVMTAKGQAEARALCRNDSKVVHLMVSDVALQDGSGYKLLLDLRTHRPGMRAVFISGNADAAAAPETRPGTRAKVLDKPFGPARLLQMVRDELDA